MVPEEFFLRYAFPCAHVLLETGVINEKRYKELEDCAKTGNFLSRKIIEEFFRDFCKVHIAKVKEILPEEFLLVEYDDKKRPVSRVYVPEAKVGDKVRIHHAYAIEMVD